MNAFTKLVESLSLDNKMLGGTKRDNCQLTNLQIFQILIMLPLLGGKGFSHYPESVLCRMFGDKKDVFYSYMAKDNIDWRHVTCNIPHRPSAYR